MGSLLPGWDQVPSSPPPAEFKWSVDRTGKRRSFDEAEAQREPRDEPDEERRAKSEELDRSRSAEIKRRSWDWWAHTPSSCLNDPLRPESPPLTRTKQKGRPSARPRTRLSTWCPTTCTSRSPPWGGLSSPRATTDSSIRGERIAVDERKERRDERDSTPRSNDQN